MPARASGRARLRRWRRRWVERGAVRAITVSYDAAGRMREVRTVVDGPEVDIQLDRTYFQKLGVPPTASAARTAGPRRPRASTRGSTGSGASSRNRGSTA
jgi:hypothetical protein